MLFIHVENISQYTAAMCSSVAKGGSTQPGLQRMANEPNKSVPDDVGQTGEEKLFNFSIVPKQHFALSRLRQFTSARIGLISY